MNIKELVKEIIIPNHLLMLKELNIDFKLEILKIYFLISLDGLLNYNEASLNKNNEIIDFFFYFGINKDKKLIKKYEKLGSLISNGFHNYLDTNYHPLTQTQKQSLPKHIRATYNTSTQEIVYENSNFELNNFISFKSEEYSANIIFDEWIQELKTGIKSKHFYIDTTKPIFEYTPGKQKKIKYPKSPKK
jgi:hypothetical protein